MTGLAKAALSELNRLVPRPFAVPAPSARSLTRMPCIVPERLLAS